MKSSNGVSPEIVLLCQEGTCIAREDTEIFLKTKSFNRVTSRHVQVNVLLAFNQNEQ
jgi:hypothetical protein